MAVNRGKIPATMPSEFTAKGLLWTSLLAASPLLKAEAPPANYLSEQPAQTQHAMVVSIHHLAADAGVEILRQGGNAVDAAVATGFALAVVHPAAGNIGGGGFMLIRLHNGKSTFIDYREKAPLAATANMYLDAKGNVIPDASTIGYKAIGVPGSVAGMAYAEKKYGRLDLKRVMQPALRLARDGFVLSTEEAAELHEQDLARFPESRRIFQRDGNYYQPGEFMRQPELARTLERIADNPDSFYHGDLARDVARAVRSGGGILTERDLATYEVKEREPVTGTYKGYTVISAPPPSSGGVALIEALNILEGYNLSRLGDRAPAEMHLIVEAYRRAYMDRADYLGDPDFASLPVDQLIDKKYATAWRTGIEVDQATPSSTLRRPAGFLPPPPKEEKTPDHVNTTHYSVVDAEGNAASVTTTLNNSFGSAATAEGLGFLLNDEMDDFAAKQGVPNLYGLIQGPANAIAPGKRPLSSMTPTIVLKDGKLSMVLGSPGGGRIITTVANIFLSVAEEGLNIQQAVDAPRFHHQYLPDVLDLEPGFSAATTAGLQALGYSLDTTEQSWSDGECIFVNPHTGFLEGGQDHRHTYGKAAGY
ncbi:Gamma-glutamyltranspeptidase [Acidisarcina polymorpha]|uniref:Glutathione hydrolase proenzyme n=1 Tax=Acidisarcina polymorpha TaxID=2211140 RepID=A0A2Z5FVY4_9BACT|nr:gamma-glutamyltransferase [Acidisarcina polymorpha]AXC11028.1 Gamma-glutamyltranspeptidase [Acidisarcina polymorpha]